MGLEVVPSEFLNGELTSGDASGPSAVEPIDAPDDWRLNSALFRGPAGAGPQTPFEHVLSRRCRTMRHGDLRN